MKATTPRGGGVETAKPKKRKKAGAGGFIFGCGGSRSVAVVADNLSTMALAKSSSSSSAGPTAEPAPAAKPKAPAYHDAEGAPSVDALLGQLRELERGVRALGVRAREEDGVAQACRCSARPPRHRQGGRGRLEEESVAVVTETEDPLGEFRRSMAEMVVENGITGGAELRELLQRFLSLNAARHHHLILRAFADVWEELFAGDPTKKLKQKRPAVSPAGHGARASS
ncbi:hypothetical protein CFC21_063192 [Triticum aestivum]|uniref:Transcription repressor n=3 Tax=Triticinae TaxID=1648030 RepID=A0A453J0T7_AEGTS|nr:uncharacterized protein LOC109772190 [Aegilops tauschii subsp. strangulata]XP_044376833.1 uncharacterized protein LOC123098822 [Triticum aestivum]KAF7055692.1 hypothetical protein CFC21_063192 [Triticum aestivum]